MDAQGYQQYKQQSIATMTQGELLMILYDELVKRLARADLSLAKEEYDSFEEHVERAINILNYLDDTLDFNYEVSNGLHRLYDFFCYELNRVKIGRNKEELDKVRPRITDLRDTFRKAEKETAER